MKDFEVKPGQEIQGFIHSLESFGTVDGPGAVSYTHLDVYKRQNPGS